MTAISPVVDFGISKQSDPLFCIVLNTSNIPSSPSSLLLASSVFELRDENE